jgi:hypothetical protein
MIIRRALILVFAAISMFGCVTGSAVAHTTGMMAGVMEVEDHGHRHDEDSRTVHGVTHQHGTADHTHDTPSFSVPVRWFWPAAVAPSPDSPTIMMPFSVRTTQDRPPRA